MIKTNEKAIYKEEDLLEIWGIIIDYEYEVRPTSKEIIEQAHRYLCDER